MIEAIIDDWFTLTELELGISELVRDDPNADTQYLIIEGMIRSNLTNLLMNTKHMLQRLYRDGYILTDAKAISNQTILTLYKNNDWQTPYNTVEES